MRKLVIAVVALALLATAAVPALARYHRGDDGIRVENERTSVRNNVLNVSNSGLNGMVAVGYRSDVEKARITTGDTWAAADVYNDVNRTDVRTCGWGCNVDDLKVENEKTRVRNNVLNVSNSGVNLMLALGGDVEKAGIHTGGAGSEGVVTNYVNTTIGR